MPLVGNVLKNVRQNVQADAWDRLVRERVAEPLRPERLRSLLVVVPAASGDVALATTVIRHVKQINPDCRISFATRRANISLIKMCPGVQETFEMPPAPSPLGGHGWNSVSRKTYLEEYTGLADGVVCPCFFPEDTDLVTQHGLNALEAIWLLAGVMGGLPPGPQRVWLESPLTSSDAQAVIRRALGRQARIQLVSRGAKRLPESLAAIVRARSLKNSGIKVVPRDLYSFSKNIIETSRPVHRRRLNGNSLGQEFVLLSTEAVSLTAPPKGVTNALVRMLQQDGRTVLHNVLDPIRAAPGTIPLVCSYEEFLSLREAGVPFVGWRSGLCDIAAASQTPMCVLYPPEHAWCQDMLAAFGFNAMKAAPDCLEFVCHDASDIRRSDILNYFHQRTNK